MEDSSSPLRLTVWERGAMRGLQCLCQRWVLYILLSILGLYLMGKISKWFSHAATATTTTVGDAGLPPSSPLPPGTSTSTTPTLNDPHRLQLALNLFAEGPPQAGPTAERHRTEALCRSLLEEMLGVPLPKVRPKWLTNPTTRRALELDMYNETRKLAFEYDGSQHDVYSPLFHKNEDHFHYRRLLDRLKDDMCREAGVLLIRIPWHQVSASDEVRTARFLEGLLLSHDVNFRSLLKVKDD